MTVEALKQTYPNLAERLPENIFTERELVVVDDNYEDADSEEAGDFEPSEYNYFAYITETASAIIGAEGLALLNEKMANYDHFDDFFASEEDLFGIQTDLNEEQIALVIFEMIEEILR